VSLSTKDKAGILILVGLFLLGGFITWLVRELQPPEYDKQTLCPSTGVEKATVVIIDKSDPLNERQARILSSLMQTIRSDLDPFEHLSIHVIRKAADRDDTVLKKAFSLCNPLRGSNVNPLYRNPGRIQRAYEAQFGTPLQSVIEQLLVPGTSPRSPIIESLNEILWLEENIRDARQRKIYILSDFFQNSERVTVFNKNPDVNSLRSVLFSETVAKLADTKINMVVVRRSKTWERQERFVVPLWKNSLEPIVASLDVRYI